MKRRSPTFRRLSVFIHPSSFQDLDWIVMKALEKDRRRRYETASGFATDVQRHLKDEPVEARPPSALYRFRKFARLWEVATGQPIGSVLSHTRYAPVAGGHSPDVLGFTPDGRTLLTAAREVARRWPVPASLPGDRERIALTVRVLTGTELALHGEVIWLDATEWEKGRQELEWLAAQPSP
jgi:hypothetical protein